MARSVVLELQEGTAKRVSGELLSGGVAAEINRSGKLDLVPTFDAQGNLGFEIAARTAVGLIPISAEAFIRVLPKVPIRSIFGMLELAYGLKSFQLGDGLVDVESLDELYERLAAIFARRILDRARRGLFRAYVDYAEPLSCIRGRLDLRASSRLLASASPSVFCEFQEHTADVEENQLLAWTLFLLCRADLHREEVRAALRAAYRAFQGSVALTPFSAADCLDRQYNRLNQDYQPLHALCRFFLDGLGPGTDQGRHKIIPYTVDMPRLFESFVARWLTTYAPPNSSLSIQHKLNLSGDDPAAWTIDILVKENETGRPLAVLDTKYKKHREPSPADVQQVVAYAVESRVTEAYLVYPSAEIEPVLMRVGDVVVRTAYFDLSGDLDRAGATLLLQLGLVR